MNKYEIGRYFWLKEEIKKQEKRKKRLEKKRQRIEAEGTVGDTVLNYNTGKGIPVRIEGAPKEQYSLPAMIKLLEKEITENIRESEKKALEIEKYINGVEDPRMRILLRCRFLDCKSWRDVGKEIYMHPDAARKEIDKHFKKKIN